MSLLTSAPLLMAAAALLTVIFRTKALEMYFEAKMKAWLESRPKRQLARRVSEDELKRILQSEREELETLCLLLKAEYNADRVTVVEFDCPPAGTPATGTCTVEERTPRMHSIKAGFQKQPVHPDVWPEILRIHALECRCLYVPHARLLPPGAWRTAMTSTGVTSAYYQTLPALPGHCGGILSISWKDDTALGAEDLAALHYSARTLAAVLRSIWAWSGAGGS